MLLGRAINKLKPCFFENKLQYNSFVCFTIPYEDMGAINELSILFEL